MLGFLGGAFKHPLLSLKAVRRVFIVTMAWPIMLSGIIFYIGHIGLSVTGSNYYSYAGALTFVGLGWNFLHIGGTALVTRTLHPSQKGVAQATNDMIIFAVGLACSLRAGALLKLLVWEKLNEMLIP